MGKGAFRKKSLFGLMAQDGEENTVVGRCGSRPQEQKLSKCNSATSMKQRPETTTGSGIRPHKLKSCLWWQLPSPDPWLLRFPKQHCQPESRTLQCLRLWAHFSFKSLREAELSENSTGRLFWRCLLVLLLFVLFFMFLSESISWDSLKEQNWWN